MSVDKLGILDKIFLSDNPELEKQFADAMVKHFSKSSRILGGGGNVHVSSLTYCLRQQAIKSYLLLTEKAKPEDFLNIYSCLNFQRGLRSEDTLTSILGSEVTSQDNLVVNGVQGHPDVTKVDGTAIYELKNTNSYGPITLDSDTLLTYLKQLTLYLVMSEIERGEIIIVYNLPMFLEWQMSSNGKSSYIATQLKKEGISPIKIFSINLSKHSKLRAIIKEELKTIHEYINYFDYSKEDTIKGFPRLDGYPNENTKCKYCEVSQQCKSIEPEIEDVKLIDILRGKTIENNVQKIVSS